MNYVKLGKLSEEVISDIRDYVLNLKDNRAYQHIHFTQMLHDKFMSVFTNTEYSVGWVPAVNDLPHRPAQKVFYTEPGSGFTIHKDGVKCRSALNIALQANKGDWVRWYDDELISGISTYEPQLHNVGIYSRDTNIENYGEIDFVDELHVETGDVYVLNVDKFHSFKCVGPHPRMILQTKFRGYPSFEDLSKSLLNNSFSGLIKE